MELLDSIAFVLAPRADGANPWHHAAAIDNVAAQCCYQGQRIAQHHLVVAGSLSPLGELVLGLAEIHQALGDCLRLASGDIRRGEMASLSTPPIPVEFTPPVRPALTVIQGGKYAKETPETEEESDADTDPGAA